MDVVLEAYSDEAVINGPIIAEFQVTLDPGETDKVFENEEAQAALDSAGVSISVSPSLSDSFKMGFDE